MPEWKHRLSGVNPEERTGNCQSCGPVTLKRKQDGWRCRKAEKKWKKRGGYTLHKGDRCEFCGFVPVDSCQLDVDHIDGNHTNNDPANLQTLCANCHRLKTKLERRRPLSA